MSKRFQFSNLSSDRIQMIVGLSERIQVNGSNSKMGQIRAHFWGFW